MGVQPDAMQGGVEARRLENLITESIAKGVELGIAKALSAIEARPASVNPVTAERPITVAGLSSSSVPAHPTFTMGSADHSVPAVMASLTAVREQPSASSSSDVSNMVHSITASSLPPQIPGRPGLDATIRANALDHLVPQKIKDKIWAREYVELSNLLQDEDQEMELKITSHSSNPTFNLVPKNKKEVNTIGKWIKAFNCFTAVYARRWPDEVPGLLKHMEVVIGLADDNAGWRMYDRSFRKLHANGLESFGQINVDLYLAAVKITKG